LNNFRIRASLSYKDFITGFELYFQGKMLRIRAVLTRVRIRARNRASGAPTATDPNTGTAPN
jgi:hypothetical protein